MMQQMKNALKWTLCFVYIFCCSTGYSQNARVDSLLHMVATAKEDTEKVWGLYDLAFAYMEKKEFEKAEPKLKEMQALAEKLAFSRGVAASYRGYGKMYKSKFDLDKALDNYEKSLAIYEKIGYLKGMADMYGILGNVYYEKGVYHKSIDYFLKVVNVKEKLGDKRQVAGFLGNVGAIYQSTKEPAKAIEFYNKALKLNKELNDRQGIAINLVCIANADLDLNKPERALEYLLEALKINEEIGDSTYLSNNLSNVAVAYEKLKNLPKAFEYMEKATEMTVHGDVQQKIVNLQNSAEMLIRLKEYKKSESCLLKTEKLLEKYNSMNHKSTNALFFSILYDSLHNYKQSLTYYRKYIKLRDSIHNDENNKQIIKNQLQFEYEKKAAADSIRTEGEKEVIAVRLKEERTQRFALYGGLALVALFAVFMFNRFRITNRQKKIIEVKEKETHQQKRIIEEKHKEITDSINYAERIQRSFLATKELLDQNLGEYFVFFKPKDVVSGDFYWAGKLKDGRFALVTADSTGHGVPGAIMSLLNITSIETSIKEGFTTPSDILNQTRNTIIERLKNDGSEEGGKDGMDCSLCIYDFPNRKLFVAAAYNPVWVVRDNKVIEVKPDNMPVGKHDKQNIPFTQHTVDLQKDDVVYTLTDGFPDQFGGPQGKKFMTKKLRELLMTNTHLPMNEQKQLLEQTFAAWVGNIEQVDDVTVVGIRI
jgi:serine phosphatase RsbU (regulator of sigma subunit)